MFGIFWHLMVQGCQMWECAAFMVLHDSNEYSGVLVLLSPCAPCWHGYFSVLWWFIDNKIRQIISRLINKKIIVSCSQTRSCVQNQIKFWLQWTVFHWSPLLQINLTYVKQKLDMWCLFERKMHSHFLMTSCSCTNRVWMHLCCLYLFC